MYNTHEDHHGDTDEHHEDHHSNADRGGKTVNHHEDHHDDTDERHKEEDHHDIARGTNNMDKDGSGSTKPWQKRNQKKRKEMKWKGTKNTDKDEKHKRTPRGKGQLYVKSDMIKCKRLEMRPLNHYFTNRPLEYIVDVTGTTYEFSTGHGSLKRRKLLQYQGGRC